MIEHYVCTDIHGMGNVYQTMMDYLDGKDYVLYCLGDAADRGRDGYYIMKQLLNNPRVVYLMGNHEELFINSMQEFWEIRSNQMGGATIQEVWEALGSNIGSVMDYGNAMRLHYMNGGSATMKAWIKDKCNPRIYQKLLGLPYSASCGQYDMCHAGCLRADWDINKDEMIWNRSHFDEDWFPGRCLIHGHTPNVAETFYAHGTKLDLDCHTYATHCLKLFNLDTNQTILFKD